MRKPIIDFSSDYKGPGIYELNNGDTIIVYGLCRREDNDENLYEEVLYFYNGNYYVSGENFDEVKFLLS